MSNADVVTKRYMQINSIFADAFNYLLYDGRAVIDPDGLRELDSTELAALFSDNVSDGVISASSTANVETIQKYRDVLKSAVIKQDDIASYVILGIENQTKVNYAIAVKNIIYDALQYGRQVRKIAEAHRKSSAGFKGRSSAEFLSGFCKDDYLMPVITLVVHFGADEWDGPLSLHDMIKFDDPALVKFVPDYPVHIIDPARLRDDELLKFSTSLREVLQYIKYSKDKEKLVEITTDNPRMFLEMSAAQVIGTVTDTPFNVYDEEGEVNMCQAIRELMEDARAEGRAEMCQGIAELMEDARAEGRAAGKTEGEAEGIKLTQSMQAWLKDQGRIDDIMRTISDNDFRDKMIEDYKASLA